MSDGALAGNAPAPEKEINGVRNLGILALAACLIAIVTTVIGVYMYVSSGDIYLDRSLPGLLPEVSEPDDRDEQYIFSDFGSIDEATLEEFLEHFGAAEKEVEVFKEPFADAPLSDETLIFLPHAQADGEL